MRTEQEQWQGFQQFCQSHNSRIKNDGQVHKQQKQHNHETLQIRNKDVQMKTTSETKKLYLSPYRKNKPKPSLIQVQSKKQQQIEQKDMQQTSKNNKFYQQSPSKQNTKMVKYQRIPIMKKQDEYRYTGTVAYRCFAPRSSDTYFRTLKKVDFNNPASFKMKGTQLFQFNSKIQSGNLGAVFQGWRLLI